MVKKDEVKVEEPKATVAQMQDAIGSQLLPGLDSKTFSSGKKGFFNQGKIVVEGERYQAQVTLVKIDKKD